MRFADKLFALMSALLTVIFAVFGTWMLTSYFAKTLERETGQGISDIKILQYMFTLAYSSVEEYGVEYAVVNSMENVGRNFDDGDNFCFAIENMEDNGEKNILYGETMAKNVAYMDNAISLYEYAGDDEISYGIRKTGERIVFFAVSRNILSGHDVCIGICRDITEIYNDRADLLKRYRLALVGLIFIGSIAIYFVAKYITRPIRILEKVTEEIADGNLDRRSHYSSQDEIGRLSDSMNIMADKISEQMKEIRTEAEKKELEAKQKEDFTAAFAHELKTPLTSIIGYADMLNSIELSEEEKREAYYYIFSQGRRLESLSHKLLELADMNKNDLNKKPVSTLTIQDNLRSTMRPIFKKRAVNGKIVMEKGTIHGDYELLLSLFYNLLDNAVKAVEKDGFILLKGEAVPDGYQVKVVDNGRGIPENEIGRITEAFYMVDKSRSRKEGGAGIGLALCSRIVELHNASLKIASCPGEGTVMCVIFPKEENLQTKEE
jgi:signal transduction histidine kinase